MGLTYFKRYRMELDLGGGLFSCPELPSGYRLYPWGESLLDSHAETKYRSFRFEIDASVFACFGERDGCRRLMHDIASRASFIPQATWLIGWQPHADDPPEFCGTIQGIADRGIGMVQNLGVTPEHRGQGLGTILLYHAASGFRQIGLGKTSLEVTAQNLGAVQLYRRLGFRTVKTTYKASQVAVAT